MKRQFLIGCPMGVAKTAVDQQLNTTRINTTNRSVSDIAEDLAAL